MTNPLKAALMEIAAMPEAAIWAEEGKLRLRGIPRRLVPILAEHKAEVLALLEGIEEPAVREPRPEWVNCGDCARYTPDPVNPPQGAGRCAVTVTGLPPAPVRGYGVCYPQARRKCTYYAQELTP